MSAIAKPELHRLRITIVSKENIVFLKGCPKKLRSILIESSFAALLETPGNTDISRPDATNCPKSPPLRIRIGLFSEDVFQAIQKYTPRQKNLIIEHAISEFLNSSEGAAICKTILLRSGRSDWPAIMPKKKRKRKKKETNLQFIKKKSVEGNGESPKVLELNINEDECGDFQ